MERIAYNIFLYAFTFGSGVYAGMGIGCNEPDQVKVFYILPTFIVCLLVIYFSSKSENAKVDDVTSFIWRIKKEN